MTTHPTQVHRPLSTADKAILGGHLVLAAGFGTYGFLNATDPGWSDLQRAVVLILVGLWLGGIALMAVLARRIDHRLGRYALLLAGPFVGILLLIGQRFTG
ncbi:MAG: hypothetical protein KJO87_03935 [Acidimicrobiia bacterium]|nr:hypothetical protein [Acidimicrobiia bacterium]